MQGVVMKGLLFAAEKGKSENQQSFVGCGRL